jgi:hypothetical protein
MAMLNNQMGQKVLKQDMIYYDTTTTTNKILSTKIVFDLV